MILINTYTNNMDYIKRCVSCGDKMYEQEVLANRTTSPLEEDRFEPALVCDCGRIEEF